MIVVQLLNLRKLEESPSGLVSMRRLLLCIEENNVMFSRLKMGIIAFVN